jgi:hypothetical protein
LEGVGQVRHSTVGFVCADHLILSSLQHGFHRLDPLVFAEEGGISRGIVVIVATDWCIRKKE